MPFRRLRRRHTVTGPPQIGGPIISHLHGTNDPGKDPVEVMQKQREDEEAKARQMITSDLLAFCVYILQSLVSLIIALIYFNSSSNSEQQDEADETEEDGSMEEDRGDADSKKKFQKVVVASNVVDMFNSYKDTPSPTGTKTRDELMTLIERKSSTGSVEGLNTNKGATRDRRGSLDRKQPVTKFSRPTEELLKKAKRNKQNNANKNINLQSMMYSSN